MAYEWLSGNRMPNHLSLNGLLSFHGGTTGSKALSHGQHPTVADNFQSGIPISRNILLSSGQADVLSLLAMNALRMGGVSDADNRAVLEQYSRRTRSGSWSEFTVCPPKTSRLVHLRWFTRMMRYNWSRELSLAKSGLPSKYGWYVIDGGEIVQDRIDDSSEAMKLCNTTRSSSSYFSESPTHYIIGDYRYTSRPHRGLQ